MSSSGKGCRDLDKPEACLQCEVITEIVVFALVGSKRDAIFSSSGHLEYVVHWVVDHPILSLSCQT